MSQPLVTIVTPSYNQGCFIRATIESVLAQDYPNLEYIIMDGGSTDETASVVGDYASRLTFISEKDRGQSHAINKGFRMAKGSILAWLNSDDLFLPGAVSAAVDAFNQKPHAGAVYGEGFLIDREGNITSRFPHTEPLNLWKLVHLSDYILQQTVFFRKEVLETVGYIDEDLHYIMDWDILIQIGKQYPIEYIPREMGCLREYPEAKSFSGGAKRVDEIRRVLQKHTGMRVPFGYVVYGLDTYHQIWCSRIDNTIPPPFGRLSRALQAVVRHGCGYIVGHTIMHSQGLYSDNWAAPCLRYMLPPGEGAVVLEGTLPDWRAVARSQVLNVVCNGVSLGEFPVSTGEFRIKLDPPASTQRAPLHFVVSAKRSVRLGKVPLRGDRRRVAYLFRRMYRMNTSGPDISFGDPAQTADLALS